MNHSTHFNKIRVIFILLIVFYSFLANASQAHAEDTGFEALIDALEKIIDFLTGSLIQAIATLTICCFGIGIALGIFGPEGLRKGLVICFGVSIAIKSALIVSWLFDL